MARRLILFITRSALGLVRNELRTIGGPFGDWCVALSAQGITVVGPGAAGGFPGVSGSNVGIT
jgi:hypothetical protein